MNASELIDQRIAELGDWRGEMIVHLRNVIHEVSPDIQEDWKWGSPIFVYNGMICSLGSFSNHIKIHFFKGAALSDPHKLFNAGLEAKSMRGIDLFEGDTINESHLKELIKEAMVLNSNK